MMHSMNASGLDTSSSAWDYRSLLPTTNSTTRSSSSSSFLNTNYETVEADAAVVRSYSGSSTGGNSLNGGGGERGGMGRIMSGFFADSNSNDEDPCSSCEMTWRERLLGCGTCMVAGYILSFGSVFRIANLLRGDPVPYVLNITIGNLIALTGSCFLSGPRSQMTKMWHESRRTATLLYLGSLFLTLLVTFLFRSIPGRAFLLILLLFSQYVSVTWYCLSYIPYAREWIANYAHRRWGDVTQ